MGRFLFIMTICLLVVNLIISSKYEKKRKQGAATRRDLIKLSLSSLLFILFTLGAALYELNRNPKDTLQSNSDTSYSQSKTTAPNTDESADAEPTEQVDLSAQTSNGPKIQTVVKEESDNPLMNYHITEHNIMSGTGNNVVGKRGHIEISRHDFLTASPADVTEFVDFQLDSDKYNWFTVDFGDGTGFVIRWYLYIEYGRLNDEGVFGNGYMNIRKKNGLYDLSRIPIESPSASSISKFDDARASFDIIAREFPDAVTGIEGIEAQTSDWKNITVVVPYEWCLLEEYKKERYCQSIGYLVKDAVVSAGIVDNMDYVHVVFEDSLGVKVAESDLSGYKIIE